MIPPMSRSLNISSKLFALLIIAAFSLTGCAKLPYKNSTGKPVTANPAPAGYNQVQHIKEDNYEFFLFWGLVPFKVEGQDGAFRNYIHAGDAIVNVRTEQEWDIISWLASGFTYGIVHLVHAEYQGDLVKKS